jgi:protein phosphatase
MIFLRRISNSVRALFGQGLTPLNRVKTQITRLRTNNIFTQAGQNMKSMQGRLNYYTRLPQRYLGISSKSNGGKFADGKDDPDDPNSREDNAELHMQELGGNAEMLHWQQIRLRRGRDTVSPAQHTQVHLWDRMSGQHDIVHVGFGSGRTQVQHLVNGEMLLFTQAMPDKAKTENAIIVSTLSPDVKLNGQPLEGSTFLPHGSEMNVKGRRYHVDLQVNERLTPEAYVDAAWETNIGLVRRDNQDAIGLHQSDGLYLFAVADGVGSGYGGDKMSEFTINYLLSAFDLNHYKAVKWEDVLDKAVRNANTEIRNFLRTLQQHGGTTLTTLIIEGWTATILHVGDSRLYLMRNRILEQITPDHVAEIPADDASTSQIAETRLVLTKALGKADRIEPDLWTLQLQPGDRLLLCTDGITGRVPDEELSDILRDVSLRNVPHHLVTLSNERNNTDNASAVVLDILNERNSGKPWEAKSEPRVYVGGVGQLLQLKKIEKTGTEQQRKENKEVSDDDENGIGCGCVVLSLLLIALLALMLWGSGFPNTFLDADASVQAGQVELLEISSTPTVEITTDLVPTSTETISATLIIHTQEATVTAIRRPSVTPDSAQLIITLFPTQIPSVQMNIITIVTPTESLALEVTSTVRPANPPR